MVELQLPKLRTRVRFPSLALGNNARSKPILLGGSPSTLNVTEDDQTSFEPSSGGELRADLFAYGSGNNGACGLCPWDEVHRARSR